MTQRTARRKRTDTTTILQLTCEDFQRHPDGSWETTRQINIAGDGGEQMLIPTGRRFTKGQMFILGLDLVAVLERHCS